MAQKGIGKIIDSKIIFGTTDGQYRHNQAPAPLLGCVYPSHPWFKKSIRCANDAVTRVL
jgi:hypothetical protein